MTDIFEIAARVASHCISFCEARGVVGIRVTGMKLDDGFFECRVTGQLNGVESHNLSSKHVGELPDPRFDRWFKSGLLETFIRAINSGLDLAEKNMLKPVSISGLGFNAEMEHSWCRIRGLIGGEENWIFTKTNLGDDKVFVCRP